MAIFFQLSSKINSWQLKCKVAYVFIVALTLSGCSDTGLPTGAGAGDESQSSKVQAAVVLLQPYVGVYQLQDSWMGNLGDQAYLSIRLTANDGVSEVALIDYDDIENCVPQRFSMGEVRKDPFSDRIFMDDISQFNEAELTLSGNNLFIEILDFFDTDNDNDNTETVTLQASKLGITELDLGDPC